MATTPFSVCKEFCAGGGGASNAKDVKYDNTNSGLKADNVGSAIDELFNAMDNKAEKSTVEEIKDKAEGIEKDVSALDNSFKTVSDDLLNHDSNENIHVTPAAKSRWDNKYTKEEVDELIEELRGDIHAEIVPEGNRNVLYIMNSRFKLFD